MFLNLQIEVLVGGCCCCYTEVLSEDYGTAEGGSCITGMT